MIKQLIVLIGPPGSGKGTLGQWLQKTYQYYHLSTGSILQYALTDQTLKKQLTPIWKSGQLIDDQLISDIVYHTLQNQKSNSTIILDGFPRNFAQHKLLMLQMAKLKLSNLQIIIFDLDLKLCQKRIENRLICPTCQQIYHQILQPPKIANICDKDQTKLVKRSDEAKIMTRFSVFRQQTLPLIKWYKTHQVDHNFKVFIIDGNQPIFKIQKYFHQVFKMKVKND